QGGQDGTVVGPALGGAVGLHKRAQALGETRVRQLRGQGPPPRGVEVAEEGDGVQAGRRACGLELDWQRLSQGRRELSQRALAFHHQGKHGTGVAAQPLRRLLELSLQALRRNRLQHVVRTASGSTCSLKRVCPMVWKLCRVARSIRRWRLTASSSFRW